MVLNEKINSMARLGEMHAAQAEQKLCLELAKKIYGETNEKYAKMLENSGLVLAQLHELQKASEYFR